MQIISPLFSKRLFTLLILFFNSFLKNPHSVFEIQAPTWPFLFCPHQSLSQEQSVFDASPAMCSKHHEHLAYPTKKETQWNFALIKRKAWN